MSLKNIEQVIKFKQNKNLIRELIFNNSIEKLNFIDKSTSYRYFELLIDYQIKDLDIKQIDYDYIIYNIDIIDSIKSYVDSEYDNIQIESYIDSDTFEFKKNEWEKKMKCFNEIIKDFYSFLSFYR